MKAVLILNKKQFIKKAPGSFQKGGCVGNKGSANAGRLQGVHVAAQTHS